MSRCRPSPSQPRPCRPARARRLRRRRREQQSRRDRQRADRQRRRSGADQRARGPDPGRSQSQPAGQSQQRPPARGAGPGAISGRCPPGESGGAGARRAAGGGPRAPPSAAACGGAFDHGPQWASRMPAEFPAYPGGRVTEAAGNDHGDCRMRVVTFTTADAPGRVLERYRGLAARAGYSAEQQAARRRPGAGRDAGRQRLLSDRDARPAPARTSR